MHNQIITRIRMETHMRNEIEMQIWMDILINLQLKWKLDIKRKWKLRVWWRLQWKNKIRAVGNLRDGYPSLRGDTGRFCDHLRGSLHNYYSFIRFRNSDGRGEKSGALLQDQGISSALYGQLWGNDHVTFWAGWEGSRISFAFCFGSLELVRYWVADAWSLHTTDIILNIKNAVPFQNSGISRANISLDSSPTILLPSFVFGFETVVLLRIPNVWASRWRQSSAH